MKLSNIKDMPTINDNVHESIFRDSAILDKVLTMIERGDSKETIFEIVEMLKERDK